MCGIAAAWGRPDEAVVQAIMDDLVHRGPDASGSFLSAWGTGMLGHRRLSIMDPGGGHQPICSGDGRRAVIANGEIYNFPDVRPELERRHRFRSLSDSEAILHLYEEYGPSAVEHLDGMWAFALSDGEDLFVARDPLGIKPLYMGRRVTARGSSPPSSRRWPGGPTTCRSSRPGPRGTPHAGGSASTRSPSRRWSRTAWQAGARRLRTAMDDCVGRQRMSDVPVGAFLSGGLDSSILAALLRRHAGELPHLLGGSRGLGRPGRCTNGG